MLDNYNIQKAGVPEDAVENNLMDVATNVRELMTLPV